MYVQHPNLVTLITGTIQDLTFIDYSTRRDVQNCLELSDFQVEIVECTWEPLDTCESGQIRSKLGRVNRCSVCLSLHTQR